MSSRRAAIRRERKEREKAIKSRSPSGEYMRACEDGKIAGRQMATFIVLLELNKNYGWKAKRCIDFIEKGNAEAVRWGENTHNFIMSFWENKVEERFGKLTETAECRNLKELAFLKARNDFFCTALAVMAVVLSSDYGFSSNGKGTGRLDRLIDSAVTEYGNVLSGKTTDNAYIDRIAKEIGIDFR